jgi:hypothetical protein
VPSTRSKGHVTGSSLFKLPQQPPTMVQSFSKNAKILKKDTQKYFYVLRVSTEPMYFFLKIVEINFLF